MDNIQELIFFAIADTLSYDVGNYLKQGSVYKLFPDFSREQINENLEIIKQKGYINFTFALIGNEKVSIQIQLTTIGIEYYQKK
jgi:hypothetical protein